MSKDIKIKIHTSLSLEGALMNFKDREWKNCVTDADGKTLTPEEVKRGFIRMLSEGKKKIPFASGCEGFDYEKGCPGHPIKDPE